MGDRDLLHGLVQLGGTLLWDDRLELSFAGRYRDHPAAGRIEGASVGRLIEGAQAWPLRVAVGLLVLYLGVFTLGGCGIAWAHSARSRWVRLYLELIGVVSAVVGLQHGGFGGMLLYIAIGIGAGFTLLFLSA